MNAVNARLAPSDITKYFRPSNAFYAKNNHFYLTSNWRKLDLFEGNSNSWI